LACSSHFSLTECLAIRPIEQGRANDRRGIYAMPLRVADAIAVLDRLGIERAHFIGRSWGGRLCCGVGEHAPVRGRSLVIGVTNPMRGPTAR
jgi:3-oxoadipate enol-lactonase/4-carboxymuconolactone decarboxylase